MNIIKEQVLKYSKAIILEMPTDIEWKKISSF